MKFYQDKLEMLKLECFVLGLILLVLGVFSKFTLNIVNKGLKNFETLFKKGFEFGSYNKNSAFIEVLVLSLSKADSATKN